ncbi:similar to Saccharomyces cerevisiae YIL107C PFK26 6-phosphofructo-2-kinase, inhibited by phosphoenolpyruvate and sn-glycerol 3-phosphate [Maudiozyma saulgeensis]|uniref:Similar to Saccharomyces cerevisiae YIL107C PFK26 6-phosphofructo-2-kinase, inhibited by phosphoenolpyruvate and sn-glycerol 3-phosphate n=1 Tax=Maudiozyma saulgeensis TaxID=1789683 RepID=A0A1X7R4V3_9SACH|nr:similar to Saccharomyces cerevisiae YIL107C PFK26 6-phosphofructo-2-kinase, inhibited by phosphoenolpyruvate and sn-glycerol 3-phosphate [Kazachstania saulgeensis]
MFKKISYKDGSVSQSPYDSDVEPKDSTPLGDLEGLHSPDDLADINTDLLIDAPRHVIINLPSSHNPTGNDIVENNEIPSVKRIPSFKIRPLSDTPINSSWTSPNVSGKPSPISSHTELKDLPSDADIEYDSETQRNTLQNKVIPHNDRDHASYNTNNVNESVKEKENKAVYSKRRPTTIDVPGLTKSKTSPDGMISNEDLGSKLIIIMVGLPATGKSFITNKLSRYLNYSMYYCQVFNVGNTRRRFAKEHGLTEQDSNFFDPHNSDSTHLRDKWALDTLDELLDYLTVGRGSVGIFDATNTTKKRRKLVLERIHERSEHLKVLYLESVCTNQAVVENNIKLKLFGPDYKGKNPEDSLRDFKDRLKNYLKAYEPIEDDEDIPYIKMIDVGKKIIAYDIQGFLASQTVYYLLNFNLAERQIWITRNGESEDNMLGKIGGNSKLTVRGLKYAKALSKFIDQQRVLFYNTQVDKMKSTNQIKSKDDILQEIATTDNNTPPIHDFFVWTSMRTRSIETAQYFNDEDYPKKEMKMLDELNAGDYEGMTYPEIQKYHADEFEKRQHDKLRYRYPGTAGESYMDVINRLRPVITELERIGDSALIVTHRVVARALLGYYMNLSVDVIANLDVPLHCVYCLETKPYGITWSLYEYDIETDTFHLVPETDLNTTTVEEVGLVHKERKYSVVPTAPTTADAFRSDFLSKRRASVSFSDSGVHLDREPLKADSNRIPTTAPGNLLMNNNIMHANTTRDTHDRFKKHNPVTDTAGPYRTTNMNGSKPSLLRQDYNEGDTPSLLKNDTKVDNLRNRKRPENSLELKELNDKLAKLQFNLNKRQDPGKGYAKDTSTLKSPTRMERSHSQS